MFELWTLSNLEAYHQDIKPVVFEHLHRMMDRGQVRKPYFTRVKTAWTTRWVGTDRPEPASPSNFTLAAMGLRRLSPEEIKELLS